MNKKKLIQPKPYVFLARTYTANLRTADSERLEAIIVRLDYLCYVATRLMEDDKS